MFKLGRPFGIQLEIDYWYPLLPIIVLLIDGFDAMVWVFILGLCVILHEFGHASAAMFLGYRVKSIVLHIFGGLAAIEEMDKMPWLQSFVVSVAGPSVSLAIGLTTEFIFYKTDIHEFETLAGLNIMLAAFNMLPIFPLDGGRASLAVMRALLGDKPLTMWACYWLSAFTTGIVLLVLWRFELWFAIIILVPFSFLGLQFLKRQVSQGKFRAGDELF